MKQLDAGFLRVTSYSDWIANIVPVPKKDGQGQPQRLIAMGRLSKDE